MRHSTSCCGTSATLRRQNASPFTFPTPLQWKPPANTKDCVFAFTLYRPPKVDERRRFLMADRDRAPARGRARPSNAPVRFSDRSRVQSSSTSTSQLGHGRQFAPARGVVRIAVRDVTLCRPRGASDERESEPEEARTLRRLLAGLAVLSRVILAASPSASAATTASFFNGVLTAPVTLRPTRSCSPVMPRERSW